MIFNEAEKGGAPGGGSSTQAAKPQEPTGDTIEGKLESSKKISGDYFKQLSGAMREKDEAVSQVSGLTARAEKAEKDLKSEQAAHVSTKGDLQKAQGELVTMTQARDAQTDRATKAEKRTTLLESYAKHHNLDLAGLEKFQAAKTPEGAAPETGGNAEGKALYDQWQALKKSDSAAATTFFRENKKALREYSKSLGK